MTEAARTRTDARQRIVEVAARLLRELGPTAVTTRGVAESAGVQAPAIYRLFGDKDGLLEAVAEHVMSEYVDSKAAAVEAATTAQVDPVDDLRIAWRAQIEFGLTNPTLFRLLSDPDRVSTSPAARRGRLVLEARVARVAAAGGLRVVEHRAVDLIQAGGIGTIHALLATPPAERDDGLAEAMLEAVLGRILTGGPTPREDGPVPAAITLAAVAPQLLGLSDAERRLLTEWLDRTIATA